VSKKPVKKDEVLEQLRAVKRAIKLVAQLQGAGASTRARILEELEAL
jgi:hypothetical protein